MQPCFTPAKQVKASVNLLSILTADLSFDKCLVHGRVTPSIQFAGTDFYTWVKRGTVRVKCLARERNTKSPPGLCACFCFFTDGKQHKPRELDMITGDLECPWHGRWFRKFTVRFRPIRKELEGLSHHFSLKLRLHGASYSVAVLPMKTDLHTMDRVSIKFITLWHRLHLLLLSHIM